MNSRGKIAQAITIAGMFFVVPAAGVLSKSQVGHEPASFDSSQPTRLVNGQQVDNLSGAGGSQQFFYIDIPDNTSSLIIDTFFGTGDVDLFVRFHTLPTEDHYDCISAGPDNRERCEFNSPPAGRYFIMLDGWTSYSGVTLQATYEATGVSHPLTVEKTGPGPGHVTSSPARIDCGIICSALFTSGTNVTLTAVPDAGSAFTGWSGNCSGSGQCTVNMTQSRSVTANFDGDAGVPEVVVDARFSGLWYYPVQDGHGFSITVHSATSATVFWYTFDPFGFPIWILGAGDIQGNRIETTAYIIFGMVFGTWDPFDRQILEWGTFDIEFHTCNTATLTYDSVLVYESGEEFGAGAIPLERLAFIDGLEC